MFGDQFRPEQLCPWLTALLFFVGLMAWCRRIKDVVLAPSVLCHCNVPLDLRMTTKCVHKATRLLGCERARIANPLGSVGQQAANTLKTVVLKFTSDTAT